MGMVEAYRKFRAALLKFATEGDRSWEFDWGEVDRLVQKLPGVDKAVKATAEDILLYSAQFYVDHALLK